MNWQYSFDFSSAIEPNIIGDLVLHAPQIYPIGAESAALRTGLLQLNAGKQLEIALYHNADSEAFFYLSDVALNEVHAALLESSGDLGDVPVKMQLPGQFILGSSRTRVVHNAVANMLQAPNWSGMLEGVSSDEILVFPILREGVKYGIPEALLKWHNLLADEILVDAHHVDDPDVPGYGRRTEITVFKDGDLTHKQRESVRVAVVGDSIASGTVIITVIEELRRRYANLEQIEVIAPLAALRGLARITSQAATDDISIRIHGFESVINALAPDYYWSAHYAQPGFHFDPELENQYRAWWGHDRAGKSIADTACAGYGWSEAFFNPRKHLSMIEQQLSERHDLSIADLMKQRIAFAE